MNSYLSAKGIKGVLTISHSVGGGGGGCGGGGGGSLGKVGRRRISHRAVVLPVVLVFALLLSFLFVRTAFFVLESATVCSSPLDCLRWRFFGGSDGAVLREELTRALLEEVEGEGKSEGEGGGVVPVSFSDLVKDMTSNNDQGITSFAFKTKAMMLKMEHLVQVARRRESVYWHLASHSLPKPLHCLSLKLAEEYAVNAMARSQLPPPEFVSRLTDNSLHHVVLLTDNVLAASVSVSSATKTSTNPEKLVFHIVTDKKTYTPMHAWFSVNPISSGVIEVKGLHQYDWSHDVNIGIEEMLEIHRLIWRHSYDRLKGEQEQEQDYSKNLEILRPTSISLLNHLRIYIPELFPDLNKIVFFDDDIVVQHDLSSLWDLDLNGKVVGAVTDSRQYKDYFNFSNPIISSNLDFNRCGWLYGMNVFDIQAWRKTNITTTYHQWLRHNLVSGFDLWRPGAVPPALIAFEGHVQEMDPSWHVAGLGFRDPQVNSDLIKSGAVIHFSGPAKPWLEIGNTELRSLWYQHVNSSNECIRKCGIIG